MSDPSAHAKWAGALRALWVATVALIAVPALALIVATGIQSQTNGWSGSEPFGSILSNVVFSVAPSALTGGFVALALALALRVLGARPEHSTEEDTGEATDDAPVVFPSSRGAGAASWVELADETSVAGGGASGDPRDLDRFRRPSTGP